MGPMVAGAGAVPRADAAVVEMAAGVAMAPAVSIAWMMVSAVTLRVMIDAMPVVMAADIVAAISAAFRSVVVATMRAAASARTY